MSIAESKRQITRPPARAVIAVLGIILLTGGLGGCSGSSQPSRAQALAAGDHYTMRGEIVQLPDPSRPASELLIHHEPVNGFRNAGGRVVGMNSMTMPFDLAEGVSAKDLHVGQKVRFVLAVNWNANVIAITSITRLAPDTELHFGKAHSSAEAAPAAGTSALGTAVNRQGAPKRRRGG